MVLIFVVASHALSSPANAAETSNSGTIPTEFAFYNTPVDFPSFLSLNSKDCRGINCDWRTSKTGNGNIDFPRCEQVGGKNCIKSVEVSTKSSKFLIMEHLTEISWTKVNIISSTLEITGGAPSVWTSRDENGRMGYFLVKVFSGVAWTEKNQLNEGDPSLYKIEIRIIPVTPTRFDRLDNATRFFCADAGIENCFKEIDFELDTRLRITVNTPSSLGGFFMGRIGDPIVKQALDLASGQNDVQIEASPVKVPLLSVTIPETATIPASLTMIRKGEVNRYPAYDGGWDEYFQFATKYSNDRVTSYITQWGVYAMSPESSNYLQCGRSVKGFLGTGTTNAMRYDFNPPVFSDGSFIFKLSGQHYQPDGVTLELGQYELVLSSEFARCLYKSGNAPLVAKIEITDANGEKNITTTTSQERDGWFRLQVAALTFSTKTIKVSLSPETPIAAAPVIETPKATPPSPKALKKILCKSGVKTKTVQGVKPVCPKGWKIAKKS